MAKDNPGLSDHTFTAAGYMATSQYYLVELSSSGVAVANGAGNYCIGVLQNKPILGQAAQVRISGISRCIAGEAIAVGNLIKTNSSGKAAVAVKGMTDTSDSGGATDPLIGSSVIGIALTAASAENEYFDLLILHLGAMPTTEA